MAEAVTVSWFVPYLDLRDLSFDSQSRRRLSICKGDAEIIVGHRREFAFGHDIIRYHTSPTCYLGPQDEDSGTQPQFVPAFVPLFLHFHLMISSSLFGFSASWAKRHRIFLAKGPSHISFPTVCAPLVYPFLSPLTTSTSFSSVSQVGVRNSLQTWSSDGCVT